MHKLSAFLLVLTLALSAFTPAYIVAPGGMTASEASSWQLACGSPLVVNLLRGANKKLPSGTVTVANDETTLFVTYETASPWTLVKTDLVAASSLAGIPVTSKGNPKVDQFPYRTSHANLATYTYEIPLTGLGNTIYIAARADLQRISSTRTEGAWAEGTPFVAIRRSWGMYFIYSVQPCNAPPVGVDDVASVTEDDPVTLIDVLSNDSDPDGDPFTIASASDPANGTVVVAGDGLSLTYQPDANYCNDGSGTDDFTYGLSPGGASATVAVTVICVDDNPVAVDDSLTVAEDSAASPIAVLANDTDVEGDPFSLFSYTQPANGTVSDNGTEVSYQPDAGYCNNGLPTDDFTYTISPGGSTATVAVTVTCSDNPPTAVDDAASVVEGSGASTINVLANDTDTDGGPISIDSVTQPANGTVVITNSGADLTYEPDANYCNDALFTDDFTYSLAPGGSTATVAVTVTCADEAPLAVDDSATVTEDSSATTFDVLANDTDADGGPISIDSVTQPANGTVVITNSGADLTYQPDVNYCNDGGPVDTFTYTLAPGGSTADVSVTVTCVDDAPSAAADAATVAEDSSATTIDVLANDIDPDGGSFSISSVTQPANGVVVVTNSGADLTYQPNANYCGLADNFTYTLAPGGSVGTVSVTVTCVNDAPVNIFPGAQSVNEDTELVFSAGNGNALSVTDVDAGTGSLQVTVSASNGTIIPVASGATILGSGTDNVTITGTLIQVNASLNGLKYQGDVNFNSTRGSEILGLVTDDQGNTGTGGSLSDTDTVNITVNAVNDPPVALAKNFSAQANMKITGLTGLLAGATDPDTGDGGYSAVFSVGTLSTTTPSGGTITNLNAAAGSFDFDPPPGATGNVTFTYTVCDSGNPGPSVCSALATVTVSVAGPVIWFVNPAAGLNGDGRLSSPFNSLASAAAVDASGHRIFVYTGTAAGGISLNSNEWLVGQGVTGSSFDALFVITPPAGTIARPAINGVRPVIQGPVAMATGDSVRGLNIQPLNGVAGLTASSASGLSVNEVSVTTLNAAAVDLSSSGGSIALTTVNANGGARGIFLNNTTGTFVVSGTGGTCTEANTSGCTGGVIQNMTGADDGTSTPGGTGIVLNNAAGVALTRMHIHDQSNYGIRGTGVNSFRLDTSVVNGVNGTTATGGLEDGSLSFDNLSGTSSILSSAISGGYTRNLRVDNTTGTLSLVINASSIHNTGNLAGDDGVLIEVGGGTATLNVTNNTFAAHGGDHFNLSLLGSPTVLFTFTGNAWSGGHPIGLGQGLFVLAASFNSPGTLTYNISNNGTALAPLVGNNSGGAIHVNKGSGTGSFSGFISGNYIGNAAMNGSGSLNASGIDVEAHGAGGRHTTEITNNVVRQFHNDGILILAGEGSAALDATVTGNTISNPDASAASLHGLHFNIGTLPTDNMQACLSVSGNSLTTAGNEANGGVDLRIRQRQLTTVYLFGYAGAINDNAAVQNFLSGFNPVTTILASNTVATGGGGFSSAACPLP